MQDKLMWGLKYLLKSALATLAYVFVVMSFILLVLIALSSMTSYMTDPEAQVKAEAAQYQSGREEQAKADAALLNEVHSE